MLDFFPKLKNVTAVMSERSDGSMKLFVGSDLNLENRKSFFEKIGADQKKVIAAEIVHGSKVELVDQKSEVMILGADGLVTKKKNVFLSVTIADCIPVYFCESKAQIVALVHAGWRGIVDGVIENAVAKILEIGGSVENLHLALGPGINQCHFEIGSDILAEFEKYPQFVVKKDGKILVDLKGIIRSQLAKLRIKTENIEDNQECTFENEQKYFSFRRDKPEKVEAMVAVIGIM